MGDHDTGEAESKFSAKTTETAKQDTTLASEELLRCVFNSEKMPYREIRENGVWKASQFAEQDGTLLTNLYKNGTTYFDRQEIEGTHVLEKRDGNSAETPWLDVQQGSTEYNSVVNEINHLDYRNPPKCPEPTVSSLDKGFQEPGSDELKSAIKQIGQEKKPLIALRYTDQSDIFAHRGELEELVYEYGKLSAARYLTPHNDTEFSVYLGKDGSRYRDKIDDEGKDNVSRVIHDGQGFDHDIPVSNSIPEYNEVLNKIHSIDWDHVPNFAFKNRLPPDATL